MGTLCLDGYKVPLTCKQKCLYQRHFRECRCRSFRYGPSMTTQERQRVPDPEVEPWVSVERAARMVGLGRGAGYAAVKRGDLPSLRIGRRVVVPTAALRRLLTLDEPAA